jgi:hypothetical protein
MRDGRPATAGYDLNVFINCPFDELYQPIFRSLVFVVYECGLRPRCALEVSDAGEVRFEKILRIIRDCRWGIHDISRTDLNPRGLPRFNMPLELGCFLGARRFGSGTQRAKSCVVLDTEHYRYQDFISDIAGQDIAAHGNDVGRAVRAVRDWLATAKAGISSPPGYAAIQRRLDRFHGDLPDICAASDRRADERTFVEYADAASMWLRWELALPAGAGA